MAVYDVAEEKRLDLQAMLNFLEEVIRPYRDAPPADVAIECDFSGDLGTIDIDRTMISQALVNLIENALQAMPGGGRLMVRAEVAGGRNDRSLQVSISDTGIGMDREALSRAFEPYFSTRADLMITSFLGTFS